MSQETNIATARQLLAGLSQGSEPGVIAALFGENVVFEIPGDADALLDRQEDGTGRCGRFHPGPPRPDRTHQVRRRGYPRE
jgi:hypothetical protein